MSPIIFLDVDGVMIAYPEGEPTTPAFTPRCVKALKSILAGVPTAKVVFSSTWRLPNYVDRLHEQWRVHGFPEALAADGTPDLRTDETVSRRVLRGMEIRAWLEMNPQVKRWVVIDDDRMGIKPVLESARCVFTNPACGLTMEEAGLAIRILCQERP